MNPQHFRDVLARAAKRLGIPHLSPHTLRHTFATRFLQAGGDIYVLSKRQIRLPSPEGAAKGATLVAHLPWVKSRPNRG